MSARRIYLRGSVWVQVEGAEPPRFLNALAEAGIRFWGAEPADDFTLRLALRPRDLETARGLAARCQCSIKTLKLRGAPAVRLRLRHRVALMAGLAVCFTLLAASRLFVWDIEVEGNETVSKGEILRALAECGVESGSFWPTWSADTIKNEVILRVPELAWVGVSVDSSRAVVRVRERDKAPEVSDRDAPYSVTARRTGIIERTEVYQGAALVEPGDAVLEGETLVSGAVESGLGTVRYVHASAKIEARTYYELTAAAPIEYNEASESKSHTRWALAVGGGRLNLYAGGSELDENCSKVTREYAFEWPGVFSLPVSLVREDILEYDIVTRTADTDALRQRLEEQLTSELERLLDGRGEALSQSFSASESGGVLYVTLRAECLEDIAAETPAE